MTQFDKVLYTAKVHTTGGRDGTARSGDGRLDINLSPPGTSGSGTNPEQLFAAGWSACFLSAVKIVAGKQKVEALADAAHQTCPYSKATRGDIDVAINVINSQLTNQTEEIHQ